MMNDAARVRLAADADAPAIAAIYRPIVETTAISFETTPPSADEMRRRIAETLPSYPWLVWELDGGVAGYAYASRFRTRAAYQWSVETSAYVNERYRGRGVGRGLYESLLAILEAQGYVNAYAGIALPNEASVRLHERVGFVAVGAYRRVGYKLGRWHDVGWWQRTLRADDRSPSQIETITTLQARDDWNALLNRGRAGSGNE